MLNFCRSFMEPCPCARSRFGLPMSNTAKMPKTWNPLATANPCVFLNHYRGMPIKDRRSCGGQIIVRPSAGQDYYRDYKKHRSRHKCPEQFPQEFQDYKSYGSQHSYCHCWDTCRCHERQQPAPPQKCRRQQQSSPPRRYEHKPPSPQRWCYEEQPPQPRKRSCYEEQPQQPHKRNCYEEQLQQPHKRSCYEEQPPQPHKRNCYEEQPQQPHRRSCYEEQPPQPRKRSCYEEQPAPPPRRYCCQDNSRSSCHEKDASECRGQIRCRKKCCKRRMCCSCESVCVVTHEVSVQTEAPDRIEIIDITTREKEVRHRTGEKEIIVDEIQTVTVVPNDGSAPTKSQVQSHISSSADEPRNVRSQLKEEIDPSTIQVPDKALRYSQLEPIMETLKDVPSNPPSSNFPTSEAKEHRVYRTNEKFEKDNEFESGKQETKTVLDNDVMDFQATPTESQPFQRYVAKPTIAVAMSQSFQPLPKQQSTASTFNRSLSGFVPKKVFKNNFRRQSSKPRVPKMVKNSQGKLVPKPRPSDFSQMSTIHMKVTNRKEKISQKAGRKSVHQDAVFETKISELRLISPANEEEPKPKPKRKKPKKKMRLTCPPPNDVVCRMHRQIQRQKCNSKLCRAPCATGGRSCGLPRFVPCSGSPYPPCVTRTTQCDPIYGFGSHPAAFYCHR